LGDVGEQSMLDPVPFAGAGRKVDDGHGKAGLVDEALDRPKSAAWVARAPVNAKNRAMGRPVGLVAGFGGWQTR
jgi:hypothetical protein